MLSAQILDREGQIERDVNLGQSSNFTPNGWRVIRIAEMSFVITKANKNVPKLNFENMEEKISALRLAERRNDPRKTGHH